MAWSTRLVLASTSPRRRVLLEQVGIAFNVVAPTYVERDLLAASPEELVERHAVGKAESVHRLMPDRVVIGVDTAVVLDGKDDSTVVHGKPPTFDAARGMLTALSGRSHRVLSGLCVLGPSYRTTAVESTTVTFRRVDEQQLTWYLDTGEWEGLAGGYAIQGRAAAFVTSIDGDYFNVVGLPVAALTRILDEAFPGEIAFI